MEVTTIAEVFRVIYGNTDVMTFLFVSCTSVALVIVIKDIYLRLREG